MTALEYATEKHKGQFRKNGKEYITHPIVVAGIAVELAHIEYDKIFDNSRNGGGSGAISKYSFLETWDNKAMFLEHIRNVAFLHDTVEDTDATLEDIKERFGFLVSVAIDHLTKREGENYLDAIKRIEYTFVARTVKRADLTHNMSDLKEGSMKDKYRLAYYILSKK